MCSNASVLIGLRPLGCCHNSAVRVFKAVQLSVILQNILCKLHIITHLSKPHVCHHPVNLAWLDCIPPAQNKATALDQARLHDKKDVCALLEPLMEKSPQVHMYRECSFFLFCIQLTKCP